MKTHKTWWETEGSGMRPKPNEDIEEFAKRITQIAWANGKYVENEACAKLCYELPWKDMTQIPSNLAFSEAIRNRGDL